MPEIKTEIVEQLPEPQEGHTYTIGEAELFTSQVKGYKGIRVTMIDAATGDTVISALWTRDIAGEKSKLGTFIVALGNNTDTWPSKKIKFLAWRPNDRKIEVVT